VQLKAGSGGADLDFHTSLSAAALFMSYYWRVNARKEGSGGRGG